MMLGTEEGGISAETARWLLYVIGSVTPSQYLDQSAQSHLRLINEFYVVDEVSEVLREAGGNTSDHPGGGVYAWEFAHRPRSIGAYGMDLSLRCPCWDWVSYCSLP